MAVDNALQMVLDQEASIGSAGNRLDFISSNLTTGSENLQPVEEPSATPIWQRNDR